MKRDSEPGEYLKFDPGRWRHSTSPGGVGAWCAPGMRYICVEQSE